MGCGSVCKNCFVFILYLGLLGVAGYNLYITLNPIINTYDILKNCNNFVYIFYIGSAVASASIILFLLCGLGVLYTLVFAAYSQWWIITYDNNAMICSSFIEGYKLSLILLWVLGGVGIIVLCSMYPTFTNRRRRRLHQTHNEANVRNATEIERI